MAKNIKGLKNQGSVQRYIPYKPLSQYTSKDISKLTFREIRGLNPQALVTEQQKIAYYKQYVKGAKSRYNKTLRETGGTAATAEYAESGIVGNLKQLTTVKEARIAYKKAQMFIGSWTSTKSGAKAAKKKVEEIAKRPVTESESTNFWRLLEIAKSEYPELFNMVNYETPLDVIQKWSNRGITEDEFRKKLEQWANKIYEDKQRKDLETLEDLSEGWTTLE